LGRIYYHHSTVLFLALIKPVNGIHPVIGRDCFLAENATIVGEVELGDRVNVWFQTVLRGDVNYIKIGPDTNIQDGVVVHGTYKKASTTLMEKVSIGHNAIIHGCVVEAGALVGMGAIVMDHAVIGEGAMVAAGSVVLSGTKVPPGMLYAGVPARAIKPVGPELREIIQQTPEHYLKYASWYD
jgi:carbonic anhydrase/acetyltransferase-like protein (isoleucine patch superfamily)